MSKKPFYSLSKELRLDSIMCGDLLILPGLQEGQPDQLVIALESNMAVKYNDKDSPPELLGVDMLFFPVEIYPSTDKLQSRRERYMIISPQALNNNPNKYQRVSWLNTSDYLYRVHYALNSRRMCGPDEELRDIKVHCVGHLSLEPTPEPKEGNSNNFREPRNTINTIWDYANYLGLNTLKAPGNMSRADANMHRVRTASEAFDRKMFVQNDGGVLNTPPGSPLFSSDFKKNLRALKKGQAAAARPEKIKLVSTGLSETIISNNKEFKNVLNQHGCAQETHQELLDASSDDINKITDIMRGNMSPARCIAMVSGLNAHAREFGLEELALPYYAGLIYHDQAMAARENHPEIYAQIKELFQTHNGRLDDILKDINKSKDNELRANAVQIFSSAAYFYALEDHPGLGLKAAPNAPIALKAPPSENNAAKAQVIEIPEGPPVEVTQIVPKVFVEKITHTFDKPPHGRTKLETLRGDRQISKATMSLLGDQFKTVSDLRRAYNAKADPQDAVGSLDQVFGLEDQPPETAQAVRGDLMALFGLATPEPAPETPSQAIPLNTPFNIRLEDAINIGLFTNSNGKRLLENAQYNAPKTLREAFVMARDNRDALIGCFSSLGPKRLDKFAQDIIDVYERFENDMKLMHEPNTKKRQREDLQTLYGPVLIPDQG